MLDDAVDAMDEPLAYNAMVTQTAISRLAADLGYKVVLTGDGGDEVFGGYSWYRRGQGPDGSDMSPTLLRRLFDPLGARRLNGSLAAARFRQRAPAFDHFQAVFPSLRPDEISDLIAGQSVSQTEDLLRDLIAAHDAPRLPGIRRWQRIDLHTFCQDAVLAKVDRAGMAAGVEARPPLLDHRIVDWGLSHPVTEDFDGQPKSILRARARECGLGFLLDEPKRGFSLRSGLPVRKSAMRRQIDATSASVGLLTGWGKSIRKGTHSYGLKLETLYWLSRWQERRISRKSGR